MAAAIGGALAYVFVRMFQVVKGDLSLFELQAKLLEQSVQRRVARQFEIAHAAEPLVKAPESYGKPLQ